MGSGKSPIKIAALLLCWLLAAGSWQLVAGQTNLGPTVGTTRDDIGQASAPANPPAGRCRRYFNTSTGLETWINSSGGSCAPSGGGGGGSGTVNAGTAPCAAWYEFSNDEVYSNCNLEFNGTLLDAVTNAATPAYLDPLTTTGFLGYSSAFIWSESPTSPSSLSALTPPTTVTITLPSCPRGLNSGVLTDSIGAASFWVDIGGTGTPETVWVQATTCNNSSNGASGTITVTPAYAHSAGYTVGTATQGVKEAIAWISDGSHNAYIRLPCSTGSVIGDAPVVTQANYVTIDGGGCSRYYQNQPQQGIILGDHNQGEYFFNHLQNFTFSSSVATTPQVNVIANGVTWTQSGGQCIYTVPFTAAHDFKVGSGPDADWIVISGFLQNNYIAGIHQITASPTSSSIQFQQTQTCPGLTGTIYSGGTAVKNFTAVEDELSTAGLVDNVVLLSSTAGNTYHYGYEWTVDEKFVVQNNNDEQDNAGMRACYPAQTGIPEWCGSEFYNPGYPGILNLENSTFYPYPANGIFNGGGNSLYLSNVNFETTAQYPISFSRYRGNYGKLGVHSSYIEPGNCRYGLGFQTISGFSGTTGTLTFAGAGFGAYTTSTPVTLVGFVGANDGLNGQVVTPLSTGLSSTQFEAVVTGSGYSSGAGESTINPVQPGCAGILSSAIQTEISDDTIFGGGTVVNWGNFGAANQLYIYFAIFHSNPADPFCTSEPNAQQCVNVPGKGYNFGTSTALPIGYAYCDASLGCSAVPGALWNQRDATSIDVVKVQQSLTPPIIFTGPIQGQTQNIFVATLNPATSCVDPAFGVNSPVCTFTDTTGLSPTSYAVPQYGTTGNDFCPYFDMIAAGVALFCPSSQSGSIYTTPYKGPPEIFVTTNTPGTNGITFTTPANANGTNPADSQLQPFPISTPAGQLIGLSAAPGLTIPMPIVQGYGNDTSTVLYEGPYDMEYQPVLANKHYPRGIFTFEDYCLFCTWASNDRRPANAADTFAALAAAGSLWYGAHVAINFSINTISPSAWAVQINSSGLNIASGFTLTIAGESANAGQATCFKAGGVIGYCSTVVSSSGGCTCN
jgi:hypothetical protein